MCKSHRPQPEVNKSTQYFRNTLCLTFLELVKREWPQNWPTLLTELCEISNRSFEQKQLVLTIFKYIAEEFVINENSTIPVQRRKDIMTFLNANMVHVYALFLNCLEDTYKSIQTIDQICVIAFFYQLSNTLPKILTLSMTDITLPIKAFG